MMQPKRLDNHTRVTAKTFGLLRRRVWVDPSEFEMVKVIDEFPDLSYLGEFSDQLGEYAVKHSSDPRQYAYFNADNVENDEQARDNYNRVMAYERGEIVDYGIRAAVTFHIPAGFQWLYDATSPTYYRKSPYFIRQTIDTPGLWGVSSDSGEEYFEEVFSEECRQLRVMLQAMGIAVGEPAHWKALRKASETVSSAVSAVTSFLSGRYDATMGEIANYTD